MAKIVDIIKYEGDNTTFVWKHPSEDFNSLSQLVVHESQEALFMMNGQALDLFGPGRHTLETQNIPEIGKFIKRLTGDTSPFHCEVYFVNKTEQMAIKWGTDSKIEFLEPTYQFPIQIGVCGEMSLRVEDSRKLLIKLVGTEKEFTQAKIVRYFRAILMTKIKSYIAQIIRERSINIFEIDEQLNVLSEELWQMLIPDFLEYGVALEKFFITTILKPDGDSTYEKFKNLHFRQYADVAEAKLRQQVSVIDQQTEAQKMVIESQAIAQKRVIEGYTYQQERGFDVAEKLAQNETVGEFANMGVGLGMMTGVGTSLGEAVEESVNEAMRTAFSSQPFVLQGQQVVSQAKPQTTGKTCPKCGASLTVGAKFCMECGEKVETVPEGMTICPQCGNVVVKGKFCLECGAQLH